MKIYLDLIFLLNFCYDFLLLLTVGIILKRVISLKRIILSAFIGALSLIILFWDVNNLLLFFIKNLVSIVMVLVAFKYKNIKFTLTNTMYLYMCSIILAGFMYYLNLEFSYHHEGFIFYYNGLSINYLFLLILGPLILYSYIYQTKKLKQKQNLYYEVKIVLKNNRNLLLNGFIDTGNKLKDPVTKKYIIILNKNIYQAKNPLYVPYKSIDNNGLMKCFAIKYVEINQQKFNNYLIGVSDKKINLDGIDCILNYKLMEDLNV